MMIMEDNSRRPPLEPVLPLINVVFLLLIFFMLAGQLAKRPTVAVDTPVSQVANGQEAQEKLLLVLKPDGQWFAEDSDIPLTGETLATLIQDLPSVTDANTGKTVKDAEIRLLADASITMASLRERLAVLQDMGVEQVRLVTQSDPASNGGNQQP
ncbi:biopolymer transporter ExbD [Alcanivorax sp. DP30]|uniref:ExbD/TolR family protein n=1 Tax=Alcanivorax sp. DP30 TaxID=2606217 RepID=UPI001368DF3A|nr:biopolymer transporter ExbD [Alcanivorax sp. DP30]MZR63671.1 biopolymer transporter ExbD [Alcanivorax sp. DP30]